MRIRVPAAVVDAVRAHAAREAPQEACGVLVGTPAPRVVVRAVATPNVAPAPRTAYTVGPAALLEAAAAAERDGLEILGFYHSHPAGPATLSAVDMAQATWDGATYLLVSLAPPAVAAWRLKGGRLRAEMLSGD